MITKSNGIIFQPIHHLNYWKGSMFFLNNMTEIKTGGIALNCVSCVKKESVPDYLPAIDAPSEPGAVSLGVVVVAAGGSKLGFHAGLKLLQSTMLFLPLA